MSDIEAGLDTETTLGEYTAQMEEMGIKVLDAQGNLRDMGTVVEEIGNNWNNLTRNQQTSLAQTIAGTRQYSRMMALFDNWDMYQDAKKVSANASGTLGKQNEIALDTLDKKLEQLTTSTEKLYLTLFDNDAFKFLIEGFTSLVDLAG
jgi:TP901 family phage tail tape measure protein